MFDILILLFLIIGAIAFAYMIYVQRKIIREKDAEITQQTGLKDAAQQSNDELRQESIRSYERSLRAIKDRELLIEIIHLIWESRDTDAAATCVRNLGSPSVEGRHYTIAECYTNLREDLGLSES